MMHAEILTEIDENTPKDHIEIDLENGEKVFLIQKEYTQSELDEFNAESPQWIFRCQGKQCFLSDSDSGEDATGWYGGYFDLEPKNAIFDNGKFVGLYLCSDGIRYSGTGRANFSIDSWGYPGYDPFKFSYRRRSTELFFFSDPESHEHGEWRIEKRTPDIDYESSYLDF